MYPKDLPWMTNKRKRPPKRLNLELVVRKSIHDTIKEYLDQCSIAGVKEIREPKINTKQRLVYAVIFITSWVTLFFLLRWTVLQTFSNPLVVTEESSTHSIDYIDFPAIALCSVNRISKKALHEYAMELYENLTSFGRRPRHGSMSLQHIKDYILQYGQLIDFSFNDDMLTYPNEHEEFENPADSHRIGDLMKQLSPNCDEMLLRCAWAGKVADCSELFTVRRTVRGHCCTFNYVLSYHSDGRSNQTTLKDVKRQNEKGPIHGLHVVLDPLIEDYAYPIRAAEGIDVFLFDPTNYLDLSGGRTIHRFLAPNEVSYVEIQSVKQLAAPEVKHYPKSTRKCLFHDELEAFGDMYSYSTCILNCRVRTVETLCKCIPYFLPVRLQSGMVCTLERLRCLNKYKEKLLYQYPYGAETLDGLEMEVEDALDCRECLPDCEFTQHFSKAFKLHVSLAKATNTQFQSKAYNSTFTMDFNLTNKCTLSVYQTTGDGALNRLDVISYWFEILSNVGGYGGILLGLSIISALELIYFVIFRFPMCLYINYKKYY